MLTTTEKELAKNINEGLEEFEITIDLKNKVIKLKMKMKSVSVIAWTTVVISLSTAIYLYISTPVLTATTGGTGGVISFGGGLAATGGAITILGVSATTFAIALGVAGGGIGVITKLKDRYNVVERDGRYFMVKK